MKVLHVIPEFVFSNTFHGAYKDVLSRAQWFEQNTSDYCQLRVRQDNPKELEQAVSEFSPTHVLFEYTRFPKMIRALRAALPKVWIGVRAHNIEPLQHLDNLGWWPRRGPLWLLYGMVRLWMQDLGAKWFADAVLSINEQENRIYWNRLPGRADVEWLPYICPAHLVPKDPVPYAERRRIACLPTSQENRKSRDLVLRFCELAREMKRQGCEYEFVVTGDLGDWSLPECPEVKRAGFVDDLAGFMGECKAICMLSPLGYGFKTTMADAVASQACLIAHPTLIRQSPESVSPFLSSLDTCHMPSLSEFENTLSQCPDGAKLQRQLMDQFACRMEKLFGRASS